MRILFVIDAFENPHAGTEGQLYRLVSELGQGDYEPHLLVFRESQFLREGGFPCDYTVLGGSASIRSAQTWRQLSSLAKGFKNHGYHLAHVFFNDASLLCPPVFRLAGIRTIISRRDMGYWYTGLYRWGLRFTRLFVDHVLVNSQAVKRITQTAEWFRPEQITVIYNGYESSEINDKSGRTKPEGWPAPDGAVVACLVANVRPIKRIQDAIRALALTSEQGVCLHLIVIGGGDTGPLVKLAEELGVSGQVHFMGRRQDVAHFLELADIGLLCSESEGFSNALIEYMRAGLPVVCTDAGGNPEAVADGETGFLYPVGDVEALGGQLCRLAEDGEKRRNFGRRGRECALARFSVDAMVRSHTEIYNRVAARQAR